MVTLGILAGGLGTRAGRHDKALLKRDGITQLGRLLTWSKQSAIQCLINSNRDHNAYSKWGVPVIADQIDLQGRGPAAGILSLLNRCETDYLLTLPIDVAIWPEDWHLRLLDVLQRPLTEVVLCKDINGLQPLCAAWKVAPCKQWAAQYLQKHDWAIHSLVHHPSTQIVEFSGLLFGNLNALNDYDPL
jgi:molybdenum cofactor guanylyltransferase